MTGDRLLVLLCLAVQMWSTCGKCIIIFFFWPNTRIHDEDEHIISVAVCRKNPH